MCSLTHGKLRYRLSGHCALWRRVASDNRPPCGLPETLRRPVLFATENTPRNPHPPDACFPPPGNSESGLLPFGQMVRSVSRPSALGGPRSGKCGVGVSAPSPPRLSVPRFRVPASRAELGFLSSLGGQTPTFRFSCSPRFSLQRVLSVLNSLENCPRGVYGPPQSSRTRRSRVQTRRLSRPAHRDLGPACGAWLCSAGG